jgi:hypothetical protein
MLVNKKIPGVSYRPNKDRKLVGMQFDKKGELWGYIDKGKVVEFTEYAGGHPSINAVWNTIKLLEKKFRCEIVSEETAEEMEQEESRKKGKPIKQMINPGLSSGLPKWFRL